ncbi:pentatricopeptide repeat-containing protein, partial [Tanacetum coccineum]
MEQEHGTPLLDCLVTNVNLVPKTMTSQEEKTSKDQSYSTINNLGWRVNEAVEVYGEMMAKGVVPDVWTYNVLIKGLCGLRLLDEGRSLFGEMVEKGVSPNVVTFNILVHSFCKDGKVGEARDWFDLMW